MGEDGRRGGSSPRVASFAPTPALGKDVVDDARHMTRALELAQRGWGAASPNPMVGAVLVRDGKVVGEGWYRGPGAGHPHAEVNALAMAGDAARGATLYCTLEPCDHVGHTPPCTRALIAAGITRAVVAADDPNPIVDGRGIARLRDAGIDVAHGPLADEARRLNDAFEHAVMTGRPLVTLKMAATLDGKVAARDGSSKWITGEASRADVHRLRAGADAIMIGAGTALADDPSLTVRDASYAGLPVLRVIVDAGGRVPATGRVFDDSAPTLVATTERSGSERREEWLRAGAEILVLDDSDGGVPLDELFSTLGKRDVQAALLEGGPTLAWSAVAGGLVHKLVFYLAPVLAGGSAAPGILGGAGFAPIGSAERVRIDRIGRVGDDIKVEAHVHRDR